LCHKAEVYLAALGGRKRKKPKRGSSSSQTEEVMAASANNGEDSMYNELKNSMDCLRQVASEGFVKLHTDLDKLRFKFKTEKDAVKLGSLSTDDEWNDDDDRKSVRDTFKELRMPAFHKPSSCSRRRRNL